MFFNAYEGYENRPFWIFKTFIQPIGLPMGASNLEEGFMFQPFSFN